MKSISINSICSRTEAAVRIKVRYSRFGQIRKIGRFRVIAQPTCTQQEENMCGYTQRDNFAPLWYPQGSVEIDPTDNSWYRMVYFGNPKDIGHKFDLAVAVFNETEHLKLREYWENAMITENWTPIKMPKCVSPPSLRKVLKISN